MRSLHRGAVRAVISDLHDISGAVLRGTRDGAAGCGIVERPRQRAASIADIARIAAALVERVARGVASASPVTLLLSIFNWP